MISWLLIFLGTAILIYVLCLVIMYIFQKKLLFMPVKSHSAPPNELNINEIFLKTSDGESLHAWLMMNNPASPVVIYMHGNAGNVSVRGTRMKLFDDLGLNALMIDYRGYGLSSGRLRKENDLYADADAAWDFIYNQNKIPANQIILWGCSLGGAIASHLAMKKNIRALVIESSFYSMDEIVLSRFWFFPVSLLLRYHFRSGNNLRNINSPLLIIHSKEDKLVPYSQATKLYSNYNGHKNLISITGTHISCIYDNYDQCLTEINSFLTGLPLVNF